VVVGSIVGRTGFVGGIISRVGFVVGEVEIRVSIVDCKVRFLMVLVKLFLRRYLICPKLNSPLVAMYSLILSLVYSIGSSSYKVLNSNLGTMAFLYFLIYTLLVYRNV
jgi:hypothetical protein